MRARVEVGWLEDCKEAGPVVRWRFSACCPQLGRHFSGHIQVSATAASLGMQRLPTRTAVLTHGQARVEKSSAAERMVVVSPA